MTETEKEIDIIINRLKKLSRAELIEHINSINEKMRQLQMESEVARLMVRKAKG